MIGLISFAKSIPQMKSSEKFRKAQNFALSVWAASAISGLGAKANLSMNHTSGAFIDLSFFWGHLSSANSSAYVYQISSLVFLLMLTVAMILEYICRRR